MNVVIAAAIGFAILLPLAGCVSAPVENEPEAGAAKEAPVQAKPSQAPAKPEETVAVTPSAPPAAADEAVAVVPAAPPAAEAPAKIPGTATAPVAKPVPKPAPRKEVAAKPVAAPPLDLNSLEKRLKDTEAIGFMTKLTLKNQVDDLLDRFVAHYGGADRASLAALRQPYDLLIIKVLSLLQDRDAPLASDILASREAIWSILSDRDKFQNLVNRSGG